MRLLIGKTFCNFQAFSLLFYQKVQTSSLPEEETSVLVWRERRQFLMSPISRTEEVTSQNTEQMVVTSRLGQLGGGWGEAGQHLLVYATVTWTQRKHCILYLKSRRGDLNTHSRLALPKLKKKKSLNSAKAPALFLVMRAQHREKTCGEHGPLRSLTCYGTRRSPACSRRWWAPCWRCLAGSPPLRWSFPTGRSGQRGSTRIKKANKRTKIQKQPEAAVPTNTHSELEHKQKMTSMQTLVLVVNMKNVSLKKKKNP